MIIKIGKTINDYGKIAVNQLLDTYIKFLDFDSAMTTAETVTSFEATDTLDLTDYLLTTSQAATKNDTVNQYMLKLNKDLMKKCGRGMTAILVDSEAAAVLGNVEGKFVANPTFGENLKKFPMTTIEVLKFSELLETPSYKLGQSAA